MVVTIDIGNTATKVAIIERLNVVIPLAHLKIKGQNPQEIRSAIDEITKRQTVRNLKLDGVAVSSTVGYSDELKDALSDLSPLYVDYTTPTPVNNCYSTPQTLGIDRLCGAIGAHSTCTNRDALVIDIGTAITYDYITKEGDYIGGNIAPGVELRFKALHDYTAKLPLVEPAGKVPEFGDSTETAIRAGVIKGIRYEIDGYIRDIFSKKDDVSVFLTGGDAINFAESRKWITFADDFLIHKGLFAIFEHNHPEMIHK